MILEMKNKKEIKLGIKIVIHVSKHKMWHEWIFLEETKHALVFIHWTDYWNVRQAILTLWHGRPWGANKSNGVDTRYAEDMFVNHGCSGCIKCVPVMSMQWCLEGPKFDVFSEMFLEMQKEKKKKPKCQVKQLFHNFQKEQ
jgi:hypothetical protein